MLAKWTYTQIVEHLKSEVFKKYLQDFHRTFFMVPADNICNSIIIVCKKYYIKTIIDELSLFSGTINKTYRSYHPISKPF